MNIGKTLLVTDPKRIIALSLLAASLVGCGVSPGMAVSQGEEMVAKQLKDEASAKFQNSAFYEDPEKSTKNKHVGWLCGEVNAKNSFGGYTGFRRYMTRMEYTDGGSFSIGHVVFDDGDRSEVIEALFRNSCTYQAAQTTTPASK